MKFTILATALALCGLSSAYGIDDSAFKVAITDSAGATKIWYVPFFDITRSEGDTPQRIGRQVFGSDNVYNGNIKAEIVSGPVQAYCYLQHWTGSTVSWDIRYAKPITESVPLNGEVETIGGISCYEGVVPGNLPSTSSRQVASTSRISRSPGSWIS